MGAISLLPMLVSWFLPFVEVPSIHKRAKNGCRGREKRWEGERGAGAGRGNELRFLQFIKEQKMAVGAVRRDGKERDELVGEEETKKLVFLSKPVVGKRVLHIFRAGSLENGKARGGGGG